jgi:hypothetical protein
MFWVGLASLIMALTGSGDDTRAFRDHAEALKEAVSEIVHDAGRVHQAKQAIERTEGAFGTHRMRLARIGDCIELLDRSYEVKAEDYADCAGKADASWEDATTQLVEADRQLRDALTDPEWQMLRKKAFGK